MAFVSDAKLRELERVAAGGDPEGKLRLELERQRCGLPSLLDRDPLRAPIPGDVVKPAGYPPARRVIACPAWDCLVGARIQPPGWNGVNRAWFCEQDTSGLVQGVLVFLDTCTFVHWERLPGDKLSPRGGTLRLHSSWLAWARGGNVLVRGDL